MQSVTDSCCALRRFFLIPDFSDGPIQDITCPCRKPQRTISLLYKRPSSETLILEQDWKSSPWNTGDLSLANLSGPLAAVGGSHTPGAQGFGVKPGLLLLWLPLACPGSRWLLLTPALARPGSRDRLIHPSQTQLPGPALPSPSSPHSWHRGDSKAAVVTTGQAKSHTCPRSSCLPALPIWK